MHHSLKIIAFTVALVFFSIGAKAVNKLDFPIGIYCAGEPTEENFKYVKSLGFDYIHRYSLAAKDEKEVQIYMDMAHKCNLKVMLDISTPVRLMKYKRITEAEALAQIGKMVERWKNHPALGFWYFYDEPDLLMSPEVLIKFHKIIKQKTPDIPDSIALNWQKGWDRWTKCADIIMPDHYPVNKESFPKSMLNLQVEYFEKVEQKCQYTIPIVQCFGYPKSPNATEMRYIMYSTLMQNPRGLFFWAYWYAREEPLTEDADFHPDYLEKTVKPILTDFKRCVELIKPVDKALYPPDLTNDLYSNNQLLVALWKKKDRFIVIMINNWPVEREVSIPLKPYINEGDLRPLFNTRDIPGLKIRKGILTLRLAPWETFIWETKKKITKKMMKK